MSNTQQKKAARDHQRLHPGTSYTEALNRVRKRPITLRIQLESTGLERPLLIDGRTAAVGNQDIWHGNPIRLIGFTDTADPGPFELSAEDWLTYDPDACLGLYPVMADVDDRWSTFTSPIESVTVLDAPAPHLPDIGALVTSAVRPYSLAITEAHHDDNEFYQLGTFAFPTASARDAALAEIPVHQHDCQDPRVKACYLIDVCEPSGDMIDNLEISEATAMRLLEVTDLGPLREHTRSFNAGASGALLLDR